MIKANIKLGNTQIQIEAEDTKKLFEAAGFFSELPQKCGHCNSGNIGPHFRRIKGYEFYSLKCSDCNHEFGLGQKKEDKSLFPKFKEGWKDAFQHQADGGGDAWD